MTNLRVARIYPRGGRSNQLPPLRPSLGYCPLLFKLCTSCEKVKPTSEFNWRRRGYARGVVWRRRSHCKTCESHNWARYAAKLSDEKRDIRYANHRDYMATEQGKRLTAKYEAGRDYSFRRTYGITKADYEAMALAQGGLCKICGQRPSGKGRAGARLVIDHCHTSGKVRGLLCNICNLGLGYFREDTHRLERAKNYILEYQIAAAMAP